MAAVFARISNVFHRKMQCVIRGESGARRYNGRAPRDRAARLCAYFYYIIMDFGFQYICCILAHFLHFFYWCGILSKGGGIGDGIS